MIENSSAGHRGRLRQRFQVDALGLSEGELLELLLTYAVPRQDVAPQAQHLLAAFGDLARVLAASPSQLSGVPGIGEQAATLIKVVAHLAELRAGATLNADRAKAAHPGSTADRLYDELVSRMVRRGEFERHDFEELLVQVAEPVREPVMHNLLDAESPNLFGTHETVRWYLRETAGQLDEAESTREEAAAQKLEAFMQRQVEGNPYESGVHYSNLFEQYPPIHDKPRRLLADWLPEFFYKTTEGTWRAPANEEERR